MHPVAPPTPSTISPKQASLLLTLNLTERTVPLCPATLHKQEMAVHGLPLRSF